MDKNYHSNLYQELFFAFNVMTSILLITVGLMVIQIDHDVKITNHNRYNIS